jgi:hypothetical protein
MFYSFAVLYFDAVGFSVFSSDLKLNSGELMNFWDGFTDALIDYARIIFGTIELLKVLS